MAPPEHHRTPLRRISHGSLSNLARSANQYSSHSKDPTRLNFLIPAFSDLSDELAGLHANLEKLNHLSEVLETFNESFASYLYALRMNAFCVEWNQAPGDTSFIMAAKAAEEARSALEALSQRPPSQPSAAEPSHAEPEDLTYATEQRSVPPPVPKPAAPQGILKNANGAKKGKMSVKDKKARDEIRRVMEAVINSLMDHSEGRRIAEIVKPPLLPQGKVNKCLIALVNRKVVAKDANQGAAVYHYRGMPDR